MPVFEVEFPSEREEDLLRRFTVNRHYLVSFRHYLEGSFGRRADLYDGLQAAVHAHPPFAKVRGGAGDLDAVRRWLAGSSAP